MPRTKNRNVVYTGRVGARMKPLRRGMFSTRRLVRRAFPLNGGPFHGLCARLDAFGGGNTLPFVARGMAGSYVNGRWVSA